MHLIQMSKWVYFQTLINIVSHYFALMYQDKLLLEEEIWLCSVWHGLILGSQSELFSKQLLTLLEIRAFHPFSLPFLLAVLAPSPPSG